MKVYVFLLLVLFSCTTKKDNTVPYYSTEDNYYTLFSSQYVSVTLKDKNDFLLQEYFYSMLSPNISDGIFFDRLFNLGESTNFFFGLLREEDEMLKSFTEAQKRLYKENCVFVYQLYLIDSNKRMEQYSNETNTEFQDWYFDDYQNDTLFDISKDSLLILGKINEFIPKDSI